MMNNGLSQGLVMIYQFFVGGCVVFVGCCYGEVCLVVDCILFFINVLICSESWYYQDVVDDVKLKWEC